MKLKLKVLMCAAAMSCLMAVPAMAAEKGENAQYKTEISETRAELKTVVAQIKEVKAENKTLSAEFKTMKAERKANGDTAISKEEWQKVKELASEVKEIRTELKAGTGKANALRKSATASIKAKDFEAGADYLEDALTAKKERLESLNKVNELLEEITSVH